MLVKPKTVLFGDFSANLIGYSFAAKFCGFRKKTFT